MIEILLPDLSKENFYEETLKTIECICDDYGIVEHFGTLSMANQMICDYLEPKPSLSADVTFRIDNDEVSFEYLLRNGDFSSFAGDADENNTNMFVLKRLVDELSFSSDYDSLTTIFHVKTKMKVQRNLQHATIHSRIFS